jgi:hypothetical protein
MTGAVQTLIPIKELTLSITLDYDGANWASWMPLLKNTLTHYKLWDEKAKKPKDLDYSYTCLMRSVDPKLIPILEHAKNTSGNPTADLAWGTLVTRFGTKTLVSGVTAINKLLHFKFTGGSITPDLDRADQIASDLKLVFDGDTIPIDVLVNLGILSALPAPYNTFKLTVQQNLVVAADLGGLRDKIIQAEASLPAVAHKAFSVTSGPKRCAKHNFWNQTKCYKCHPHLRPGYSAENKAEASED